MVGWEERDSDVSEDSEPSSFPECGAPTHVKTDKA